MNEKMLPGTIKFVTESLRSILEDVYGIGRIHGQTNPHRYTQSDEDERDELLDELLADAVEEILDGGWVPATHLDRAVVARVCAYTPGMGQVEINLPGALPQWMELGEVVTILQGDVERLRDDLASMTDKKDALRYRYLRERDLEQVTIGGVFVGVTPANLVINGPTLDLWIDSCIAREKEQTTKGDDV